MNSYNNKNHNNNISNNYNKTNSTKLGFDLIVISLVLFLYGRVLGLHHHRYTLIDKLTSVWFKECLEYKASLIDGILQLSFLS